MALSCELCAWQNYIWMSCAVVLARVLMVFKWKIYEDREQSSFGYVGKSPFGYPGATQQIFGIFSHEKCIRFVLLANGPLRFSLSVITVSPSGHSQELA